MCLCVSVLASDWPPVTGSRQSLAARHSSQCLQLNTLTASFGQAQKACKTFCNAPRCLQTRQQHPTGSRTKQLGLEYRVQNKHVSPAVCPLPVTQHGVHNTESTCTRGTNSPATTLIVQTQSRVHALCNKSAAGACTPRVHSCQQRIRAKRCQDLPASHQNIVATLCCLSCSVGQIMRAV